MGRAVYYIALLRPGLGAAFNVSFPDFPGCVSSGETFEEALRAGVSALALHVDGMRRNSQVIPEPRTYSQIRAAEGSPDYWQDVVVTVLPLLPPAGRSRRINVTIPEDLIARIDALALNRSELLTQGARLMLEDK
jgi:predicted RNase H-like HicB family nuclease